MKTLQFLFVFFPLVFLLSCGVKKEPRLITQKDNDAIEKYLDEKMMTPEFGGKIFSSFRIFQTDEDKIYLWAYMQEFFKKDSTLELGSGWSVPVVLNMESSVDGIKILSHKVPGDGENYSNDIKTLFPERLQQNVFDFSGTGGVKELEEKSKERAEKHFGISN